jgi:hypothetical protein
MVKLCCIKEGNIKTAGSDIGHKEVVRTFKEVV